MKRIFNRRKLLFISLFILTVLILVNVRENKNKIKTTHFVFIYSKHIEAEKIHELAKVLEDNYIRISKDLKTKPADNIEVNIYDQRWRYIKATGNWTASGNIEGTSKLHFVEQAWGESDSKKVAVHEFTHAVVLKLLVGKEPKPLDAGKFDTKFAKFPVWLWEATSVYEAGQFREPNTLPYFANGSYPGLDELNNRSKGGKIYSVGFTLIEYILHQYGQDKLIELIAAYGDLAKVLGVTAEEFNKGWNNFIKEKYLQ